MTETYTQDEYKTSAVDTVHINPSMVEGERFYPSILGPDRAVRIDRYAPVNLVVPSISGPTEIPGTLVCFPGVWDSSPQPDFTYQWLSDEVLISGETSSTLLTYPTLDSTELKCEVTATNIIDAVSLVTPIGITVTIIEPINIWEQDFFAVSGLNQETRQNLMVIRQLLVTGISTNSRMDIVDKVEYAASGMWVETRHDVNAVTSYAIQGLGVEGEVQLYESESYAYWQPTYLEDLAVINPSAETGDMTGWTVTAGVINSVSGPGTGVLAPADGGRYFSCFASGAFSAAMEQVVAIPSGYNTDIDNGVIMAEMLFSLETYTHIFLQQVTGYLTFLDAADQVLDSKALSLTHLQSSGWTTNFSEMVTLPATTRKVRLSFSTTTGSGQANSTYIDAIRIKLFKDEHQT